jgi:xylulokinase
MSYLLGFDIGSSSVKAALIDSATGDTVAEAFSPQTELSIESDFPGWAEQDPGVWWEHMQKACAGIAKTNKQALSETAAIGISYQMHGLVLIDEERKVLRPAILWCDSRAVEVGAHAFEELGGEKCLTHLLNSPGNFTASKLRWVFENEPDVFDKTYKALLPGDFIALRLTGEVGTTVPGLSEGVLWDFKKASVAKFLLEHYALSPKLLPSIVPTFGAQGKLQAEAAAALGLKIGTPVTYRAGDQPNNAFALRVLEPGEVAATAGTSGVIYAVSDKPHYDLRSRVNTFAHVNYDPQKPRFGTLLCCNSVGILNSWLRREVASGIPYDEMNGAAQYAEPGSEGLFILPYGNGAERSLGNVDLGASFHGLNLNLHTKRHLFRAAQEGVAFSLNYGLEIMRHMGIEVHTVRACNSNLFLSPLFREVFAAVTRATVELFDANGAQGAARGAGVGAGIYRNMEEAFSTLKTLERVDPDPKLVATYHDLYLLWAELLNRELTRHRPFWTAKGH